MPSSSAAALRFPYFSVTLIISISFVLASILLPLQLFRQKIIIVILLIGFFVVLAHIKAVLGSSSNLFRYHFL
jgi:hypothetical protein